VEDADTVVTSAVDATVVTLLLAAVLVPLVVTGAAVDVATTLGDFPASMATVMTLGADDTALLAFFEVLLAGVTVADDCVAMAVVVWPLG
jgi:hypothetical protein